MSGQTDLRTVQKGVSMIENWYKMLRNGLMTDLGGGGNLTNVRSNFLWN